MGKVTRGVADVSDVDGNRTGDGAVNKGRGRGSHHHTTGTGAFVVRPGLLTPRLGELDTLHHTLYTIKPGPTTNLLYPSHLHPRDPISQK